MTTTVATADAPVRIRRPYLYSVDLFRLITFACVIAVHVISGSNPATSVASNGVQVLLHFTREAFFVLTGFVLVYQYAGKPFQARSFWRRRFLLVGGPYVLWSVIYWAYSIALGYYPGSTLEHVRRLGYDLITGTAWYHLYFLLVTMQVYLLFPLILRLLKATEGRHRWLLLGSAVAELPVLWFLCHPPFHGGGEAAHLWGHVYATILPYQFYTLLDAVAAWHIDAVHAFVRRHGRLLVAAAVATGGATVWWFVRSVHHGIGTLEASSVFQPYHLIWFVAVIAGLYTLGLWWSDRRNPQGLSARLVSAGSDRSFGIFLVHAFVLQLLAPTIAWMTATFGRPWETVVLYVCVVLGTVAVTEVLRRIPGSLLLTGRPRLRREKGRQDGRQHPHPPARESLPAVARPQEEEACSSTP